MKNILDIYKEFGVDYLTSDSPQNILSDKKAAYEAPLSEVVGTTEAKVSAKYKTLAELREAVENFDGCKEIKETAANTVFADGNPNADIMLIGEAPGANEDKEGIPFCGQSGKLLNNILPSIGLQREDVYITNALFWRPPGNRRPHASELDECRDFLEQHIALVKPKVILLVGSTAVESLLGSKISMHELRSKYYDYENQYLESPIKTAVIFHPSYLLRQPYKKKLMWADMQKLKAYLDS